jgi:alpha-beta hydrolase superfamily lysophospholipase
MRDTMSASVLAPDGGLMIVSDTHFRTLDGLDLAGTLVTPESPAARPVVLVHGGGVTREEGGFFTRLAAGLGEAGIASLRFDLRGQGASGGLQEDLTLSAVLNDIRVAIAHLGKRPEPQQSACWGRASGVDCARTTQR